MGSLHINSEKESISIKVISNSKSEFGIYMLFVLSVISFLIPIVVVLIAILSLDLNISFGFIITIIIFGGSGLFLMKIFLWNKYGKEYYSVSSNKIAYSFDYNIFKSQIHEKTFKKIELGYSIGNYSSEILSFPCEKNEDDIDCYLVFLIDDEVLKSTIPIKHKNLKEIKSTLFHIYTSQERIN